MTSDAAAALQTILGAGWILLAQSVLIALVAWIGLRLALNWSTRAMRRARVDTSTALLIRRALTIIWIVVAALFILGGLGVSPAGLIAVAGAVGLAFSLALQDILKNFFSGIYLLLERPFRVGDTIKVKDQIGTVENIGVRTTVLRTRDNIQVLVPNTVVFAEVVTNHTQADVTAAPGPAAAPAPAPAASPGATSPGPPVQTPPA
jgi:small conductance mechanosensitive channel